MFTINRKALALARNPYPYRIGILFTHRNDDFGAISATERSCAAPRRSLEWRVTYRIGSVPQFGAVNTVTQTVSEVNK